MAKNVKRFTPTQIMFHWALIVLFMLLSVTGLAWMYIETGWGQSLAAPFGGYAGALEWHNTTGLDPGTLERAAFRPLELVGEIQLLGGVVGFHDRRHHRSHAL